MVKNKTIGVDKHGFYGKFGGAYIPEMLFGNVEELRLCYNEVIHTPDLV